MQARSPPSTRSGVVILGPCAALRVRRGALDIEHGVNADKRSIRTARKYDIDISGQVCRLFRVSDFDEFDRIFVMDKSNLKDILALARNEEDAKKVSLLLGDKIVPDPYYEDEQFGPVFKMIEEGCREIIKQHNASPL